VEGGIRNDWWEWEKQPGRIRNNDHAGRAANHYHRFREDFALAQSLGLNAMRISVEWSRLEPVPGKWDKEAVQHYTQVLDELHHRGLEPVVTLHHFTNPLWVARQGGWENPATVEAFVRLAARAANWWGNKVRLWITVNEPNIYTSLAYVRGQWPPGIKNWQRGWKVLRHFARAHLLAKKEIKRQVPKAKVGMAQHFIAFSPHSRRLADRAVTAASWFVFNNLYLRLIRWNLDFLGINYYFPSCLRFCFRPDKFFACSMPLSLPRSDIGWPVSARGLRRVVKRIHRMKPRLPLIITENGIADAKDKLRPHFLRTHLHAVATLRRKGIPLCGYFYWSLTDTFEWENGFAPRFGLFGIRRPTLQRFPRPSAKIFAQLIKKFRA
jgi:beta-glucosidase